MESALLRSVKLHLEVLVQHESAKEQEQRVTVANGTSEDAVPHEQPIEVCKQAHPFSTSFTASKCQEALICCF